MSELLRWQNYTGLLLGIRFNCYGLVKIKVIFGANLTPTRFKVKSRIEYLFFDLKIQKTEIFYSLTLAHCYLNN